MGSYLSTPKTDKTSKNGVNGKIKYGSSSMQGWRQTMEDAHVALLDLDKSTSFFGVYDGHAGQEVSKFCAKFLHKELLKHEAYSAGDIATAAKKSFLRMDEMMCSHNGWKELVVLGMDDDDCSFEEGPPIGYDGPTSGSTACVAIIHNNQLFVANAGDSRCVISRKGQACDLSKDHKPDLEVERERIYEAGGYIEDGRVNGKLNLARAIGDMDMKKDKTLTPEQQPVTANPDINTVELCEDDDFLVIACDGIWDCMSSQQLVDFIHDRLKYESKLSRVCEKVLDTCLAPKSDMEGCDNMTIILVQFKKSESDLLTSQPLDSSNGQEVTDSD